MRFTRVLNSGSCTTTLRGSLCGYCKWMCQHSRSGCENKWCGVWGGQNEVYTSVKLGQLHYDFAGIAAWLP